MNSRGQATDSDRIVFLLAAVSALAVATANMNGISVGDDGVGYQAIADSLLAGNGLGYFLENPVTVWPPLWPALMALIALITPFGTVGAAVILNCIVAGLTVLAGNRLLRLTVADDRLVLLGTVIFAVGPATIGLGHVLMTDMAFALVVLTWMTTLIKARSGNPFDDASPTTASVDRTPADVESSTAASRNVTLRGSSTTTPLGLLGLAALLAWVGFGLRYVGLTLIAFGCLWLLFGKRWTFTSRFRDAVIYGACASVFPLAWMARNHSIDGTFTGERHTSARGLIDNGFDVAATIGRFLLPGVMNEATKLWAAIGILACLSAGAAAWVILGHSANDNPEDGASSDRAANSSRAGVARPKTIGVRAWSALGTPIGLVAMWAVLYLAYMLYVRTTTALNQLDLRLLFPAYFPSVILGIALIDRLIRVGFDAVKLRWVAISWAIVNIAAAMVAMVAFGLGHPFFAGDYADVPFVEVRDNHALQAVPKGCEVYSNLPNALYPTLEPVAWSPQERALESTDPMDDLQQVSKRSVDHQICLVWIDRKPVYGHLWPLEDLDRKLDLQLLAQDGPVSVYRIHPPTGR